MSEPKQVVLSVPNSKLLSIRDNGVEIAMFKDYEDMQDKLLKIATLVQDWHGRSERSQALLADMFMEDIRDVLLRRGTETEK